MQRMPAFRAFFSNIAGIKRRSCDACRVVSQPRLLRGAGIRDGNEGGLGTRTLSGSSRYHKDTPKRIYQSAPKRQHGKNAGMRKWSNTDPLRRRGASKVVAAPIDPEGEGGEMLAFGQSGSSAARVEPREVSTKLKEIRVSPWSLNLVTKLARGLPVVEAAAQLKFCKKKHTITVLKAMQGLESWTRSDRPNYLRGLGRWIHVVQVSISPTKDGDSKIYFPLKALIEYLVDNIASIHTADNKNALNLADMRYGLAAEQMMVTEIFVTKGKVVKSIRIMGRGRVGIARRKWSHLHLTLREIDFDALIERAEKRSQREKLIARKKEVEALLTARRQEELGEIPSGTVLPPLQLNSK